VFPLRILPRISVKSQVEHLSPLPTMVYVSIYPPLTSTSELPHSPGTLMASIASRGSVACLSIPETASQLNLRDEMWKDCMTNRDHSDLSQERCSAGQPCRYNAAQVTIQEQDLTIARNSMNSNNDSDFSGIDALP